MLLSWIQYYSMMYPSSTSRTTPMLLSISESLTSSELSKRNYITIGRPRVIVLKFKHSSTSLLLYSRKGKRSTQKNSRIKIVNQTCLMGRNLRRYLTAMIFRHKNSCPHWISTRNCLRHNERPRTHHLQEPEGLLP